MGTLGLSDVRRSRVHSRTPRPEIERTSILTHLRNVLSRTDFRGLERGTDHSTVGVVNDQVSDMPPMSRVSPVQWLRRQATSFARDLKFGVRVLARAPLATTIMAVSTALGIGVTTAVFTLADVMLFRPLPYPNADRLVVPYQTVTVRSQARQDTITWTFAQYQLLRQTVAAFEDAGFAAWMDAIARPIEEDRSIRIEAITPSLLTTFSLRAAKGRLLLENDDIPDAASTAALISDHLWKSAYGGSSSVIGTTMLVNRVPVTIVGIMPRGFTGFAIGADLWMPMRMMARVAPSARWTENLSRQSGTVIARLARGVTMRNLGRYLHAAYPIVNQIAAQRYVAADVDRSVGVMTLAESRQHPLVRPILGLMAAAVAILLLIVCANIASILLARGYARRHETGVRIAMGASRGRVKLAALTESALLGALGLPMGVLLAYVFASAVGDLRPPLPQNWVLLRGTDLLAGASLAPGWRVLGFATLIAGVSTLLFGIAPAIAQSRVDAARLITGGGDSHATAPMRGRQLLVVAQVALATMLLVGAGLMTRSLRALLDTDLGFQSKGVVMLQLTSMDTSASARLRRTNFIDGLTSVPGIERIATAGCVPFDLSCMFSLGVRATDNADASARPVDTDLHWVSPDYFRVFGIPMLAGRALSAEDTTMGVGHVVIGASAARRLFGDLNRALGKPVILEGGNRPVIIVGVARDVRFRSVEGSPSPAIYSIGGEDPGASHYQQTLFVRSSVGEAAAIATVRNAVRSSGVPVSIAAARPMSDLVRDATSSSRFVAMLLVAFAAAALLLAALGVYGTIAYIVAQRSREFGIRLVLGAEVAELTMALVMKGIWLIAAGIAIGVVLAFAGSRLIAALLYGVTVFDVATLVSVVLVVGVIGVAATALSTVRVGRIDVGETLRA
jgi:putative ABC transport system permease protein